MRCRPVVRSKFGEATSSLIEFLWIVFSGTFPYSVCLSSWNFPRSMFYVFATVVLSTTPDTVEISTPFEQLVVALSKVLRGRAMANFFGRSCMQASMATYASGRPSMSTKCRVHATCERGEDATPREEGEPSFFPVANLPSRSNVGASRRPPSKL